MMPLRSLGFLCTTSLTLTAFAQQSVKDFSLNAPFSAGALEVNWKLDGVATPASDSQSVFLNVGIPGRVGYMCNAHPFPSNNFEVKFKFSVANKEQDPHKQGLAFWYVQDKNFLGGEVETVIRNLGHLRTNTLSHGLTKAGRDLMGYTSRFNGVGTIFTTRTLDYDSGGSKAKWEPAIVAAVNDGTRSMFTDGEIASALATKVNFVNTAQPVEVKMTVAPNSVKVEVNIQGTWTTVLNESNKPMSKDGYLCFSSLTHDLEQTTGQPTKLFDSMRIWDVTTTNFDTSVKVQETALPTANPAADPHGDFLYEHGHMKAHREESAAIHQLTNMVMKLIAETEPIRMEMDRTITSLGTRVANLENIFQDLKTEINVKTGHDLDKEFEDIKKELVSLSEVASFETERRKEKMKALHEDLAQMKGSDGMDSDIQKITETNNMVLESLSSGHRWSFWVSAIAILLILGAGLALYARFRKWEKRHIL